MELQPYTVILEKGVSKKIDALPNKYYLLIMIKLKEIETNPRPFGSIKLAGSQNYYRIRVGVYRIIYTIEDKILTVNVVKIDHRSSVYR